MGQKIDARALKQRNRTEKDITSPITGFEYRVRKINVVDFLLKGPLALPLAEWARGKEPDEIEQGIQQAAAQVLDKHPALLANLNDLLIVAGCASLKVVLGPECGDDEILPGDLGDDYAWLASEIMHFNGLLTDEQAGSFRRQVLAAAGRTGS